MVPWKFFLIFSATLSTFRLSRPLCLLQFSLNSTHFLKKFTEGICYRGKLANRHTPQAFPLFYNTRKLTASEKNDWKKSANLTIFHVLHSCLSLLLALLCSVFCLFLHQTVINLCEKLEFLCDVSNHTFTVLSTLIWCSSGITNSASWHKMIPTFVFIVGLSKLMH